MNTSTAPFDPVALASRLAQAFAQGSRIPAAEVPVADSAQAYAVQNAWVDQVLRSGGAVGGWKVGAPNIETEPNAAPLPNACLYPNGAPLGTPAAALRGVELELAVRLKADLLPGDRLPSREEIAAAIGEVLPVVEILNSRLVETLKSPPATKLADLGNHGALVVGAPASGIDPLTLDLTRLHTRLSVEGQEVVNVTGGHTSPDLWRLLAWLSRHAQARGLPLRAGQVITTGSCTGLVIAEPGSLVEGELTGIGQVSLRV